MKPISQEPLSYATDPRVWRAFLVATFLAYAVMQFFWIRVTPLQSQSLPGNLPNHASAPILVGTGPDEAEHYLYALSLAEQGRLPLPAADPKQPRRFVSYQAQHPPIYYCIAAFVLKALRPLSDSAVWYGLRILSAIFGLVAIWLMAQAALVAFPDCPVVAYGVAPVAAFTPIFGYMMGTVSNVPLEMALTAYVWLLLMQVLRGERPLDWRAGMLIGASLGLAAETRFTAIMWLPAAVLILLARRRTLDAEGRAAANTGILAFLALTLVIAVPWLLVMKLEYGSFFIHPEYRPMLGYITIWQYLADPHQLLRAPNMWETVRIPPLTIALWYASTSWTPFWLIQYMLPNWEDTAGAFQALFILADVFILFLLYRYWSANQGTPADPVKRAAIWGAGVSAVVAVALVLQHQFTVDEIMLTYAGRYTVSVLAASSLLLVFAMQTLLPTRGKQAIVAAAAVGLVMLLFDIESVRLTYQFYTISASIPQGP